MNQSILVLGQGQSSTKTISILEEKYPSYDIIHCSYAPMSSNSKEDYFLRVRDDKEISLIKKRLNGQKVAAVINRYDSYIPLHGKIVDYFKVKGPSSESLPYFRYKVRTDMLLRKLKLSEYRPKVEVVGLHYIEKAVEKMKYPCVLKPSVGAKSRGVYVLKTKKDLDKAIENIKSHHGKIKIARMLEDTKVLVEEYIDGKQIAPISYVDDSGIVHIVAGVDVARGPDVGQKHIQNVYRTTPSLVSERNLMRVKWLLQKLVDTTGLKSTFLDPELYIVDERIILIEINVRLGGFRNRLVKEAYGLDIDKAVIDLALGDDLDLKFKKVESCTAVEIWEDTSGEIKKIELPEGYEYLELKRLYKVGQKYIAPPEKDKPIASFYLHDEKDSKSKALEMRAKVKVSIE